MSSTEKLANALMYWVNLLLTSHCRISKLVASRTKGCKEIYIQIHICTGISTYIVMGGTLGSKVDLKASISSSLNSGYYPYPLISPEEHNELMAWPSFCGGGGDSGSHQDNFGSAH